MTLSALWLVGVFIANVVLGAAVVVGVFAFMERNVSLGAVGGLVIGGLAIWGQATIGEEYLVVTVPEMKNLVTVAAVGAMAGVIVAMLVVEPEV